MYDYEAVEPQELTVPESNEIINSWYIVGIKTTERLLELMDERNIVEIYDNKYIELKVFVKDRVLLDDAEKNHPTLTKGVEK